MTHTATPWLYRDSPYVFDSNKNCIAITDTDNASKERIEANAAFIVKAVNAHDELVEACRLAYEDWQNGEHGSPAFIALERALAKAGAL